METVKDRLYIYLELKRIAPSNFEKTIGAGGSYLKNVKTLGSDKLQSILHFYPDLNISWLLTGEGEMLTAEKSESNITSASNNVVITRKLELKEFIKSTIAAIAESVDELETELNGKVIVNPNMATDESGVSHKVYTVLRNSGFGGDPADKRSIIELKITTVENSNTIQFSIPIVINPH